MSGKSIAGFGATGTSGGAVARELLQGGDTIRAVTRDTSSDNARMIAGLGAELVAADLNDRATIRRSRSERFPVAGAPPAGPNMPCRSGGCLRHPDRCDRAWAQGHPHQLRGAGRHRDSACGRNWRRGPLSDHEGAPAVGQDRETGRGRRNSAFPGQRRCWLCDRAGHNESMAAGVRARRSVSWNWPRKSVDRQL